MSIAAAFAVPHPPASVPGVGDGQKNLISDTVASMREVAGRIAQISPDVVVICSPHVSTYYDYLQISPGAGASGDLTAFGGDVRRIGTVYDQRFIRALEQETRIDHLQAGTVGQRTAALDHGTMIPLWFIQQAGTYAPVVRVGVADGISPLEHYRFGRCIARAAECLQRKAVFVASGDLSHRLHRDGPYGYCEEGPRFDRTVCAALASGDFTPLLEMDPQVSERAAQCALKTFQVMAGVLDGKILTSDLLSYEGTLGVGYAVAALTPLADAPGTRRSLGARLEEKERAAGDRRRSAEDAYVRLARMGLETWVRENRLLDPAGDLPDGLPEELLSRRAGVFVTIRKSGILRGCVGTLEATRTTLADEIVFNAVSAGSRDPRFPQVTESELDRLAYCVDVLSTPEQIFDPRDLDPVRQGVIVSTPDGRRAATLPELKGVATVDDLVGSAREKAGIGPDERVALQRFYVARHW